MQQLTPPQGHKFPDQPQQKKAPLFPSNMPQMAQTYEPQPRMKTSGVPTMTMPTYTTGQLQALHNTQPVTTMPPMSQMPTAQVYQSRQNKPAQQPQPQMQPPQQLQPQQAPAAAMQGTPVMVHTIQGAAVVVSAEEMERALEELSKQKGKKKQKQKKELKGVQKQSGSFVMKFSVAWCIFGVIGVIAVILTLLEWVGIPLLVMLNDLIGGAK